MPHEDQSNGRPRPYWRRLKWYMNTPLVQGILDGLAFVPLWRAIRRLFK